jgi:tetratricopeptide (TPR) repeat protein
MKRFLVAALLLAGIFSGGRARAEEAIAARPTPDHLGGTPDEVEGWFAVQDEKWIRARELGEKVLKADETSYGGHYILGVAMHYGEGDLARSAFHLEKAAKLFEAKFGPAPAEDKPWRWHESTLRELGFTYGEMDRPEEELAVFDRRDNAYLPKRNAQRVWPLMKLRRYDEARKAAKAAVATGDASQKIIARSDLCAAECEAGSREKAYVACTDALDTFRGSAMGGMVEFSNASEAALSVLKYDEAERFLSEATRRAVADSWGNPYQHLATLYLTEGRIPESIDALKGGQELRLRRPAWLDQHGQARLDGTLADLLLIVGETDRAVQIAQRAVDRPDRQGTSSGTEKQAVAASALRLSMALADQARRDWEGSTTAPFFDAGRLRDRAAWRALEAWRERRRAAVLLSDEDFLVRSIRPYYVGGIDLPTYDYVELVDAVGSGVALRAIARARQEETMVGAPAFFDALEAEAEYQREKWDEASAAAERSLKSLPHAEALLRGRVAAIAGEAARRRGDLATATARFSTAMTIDPGVFRRLGLELPVEVESDGTDLAEKAASLVNSSPRFRVESGQERRFKIVLRGGADPEACLLGPSRERIQCATVKLIASDSPREGARKLVAELHHVAFAVKADLSQSDLTTLDGSPTAQRADHQVKSLLDNLSDR